MTATEFLLDPALTVNAVIARHPGTVAVFKSLGVEACCGGGRSLPDAAARAGVPHEQLVECLRDAIARQDLPACALREHSA